MASKTHEIAEFGAILAREVPDMRPYSVGDLAANLIRLGKRANTLAVALCNGWVEQGAYDRRHEAIKAKLDGLADGLFLTAGWGYSVGGDPRGCVLKLTVPSGYTNDFGREGVCVPY